MTLKIGSINLKNDLILAPMAGINDVAFRILCFKQGCGLCYTGMISSDALITGNKKTSELAFVSQEEGVVGIQVFGNDALKIAKAISIVEKNADIIDINMGCPDKKINEQGSGGALLDYPEKIAEIVKYAREATIKPLTIKIRAGVRYYDKDKFLKICHLIESNGADAIIVHPRTVKQKYIGISDWSLIKLAKNELKIPVIGNGDIHNFEDVKRMKKETNCDGFMIGRAAIGNPFIFNSVQDKNKESITSLFLEYLDLCEIYSINNFAYLRMQGLYFFKGFDGSKKIRVDIAKTNDIIQLKELVKSIILKIRS
jgi:tRNA-dihydrouridine synthase B